MSQPKLSVGLPVYNGEKYLPRALDLLLAQDFRDFELILSDNGSTDGTPEICRSYARKDSRIRFFRNETNQGATWNFRRVFELAEGIFFKWAAYDDECDPKMLGRCMAVFEQSDSSVALVYPQFEFIDADGKVMDDYLRGTNWDHVHTTASLAHQRLRRVLMRLLHGQAVYGVIRADLLRQTTPFGTIAADFVKVAELAMLGKIVEVPEVLFRLRLHPENSVAITKDWRNLLAWHNPNLQGRKPVLPKNWALVLEYLKSVRRLPLSPAEKLLCGATACLTPPARFFCIPALRVTGPARNKLRALTGWRWMARGE